MSDDDSESTPLAPDEAQYQQRFGVHFRRLREVRRLTQDELARLACLAPDTIRRLELNEFSPSLRTLRKITRGLKMSLTSLFGGFELIEFEIAREFIDVLTTRSEREHIAFAELLRRLAAELDALERGELFRGNLSRSEKPTKDPFGSHAQGVEAAHGG